jgi:tetratricopeptide (TPR) repeat protein
MKKITVFLTLITLCVVPVFGFSQSAEDFNVAGLMKIQVKDYEGAVTAFDNAIKLDSTNDAYYFHRGLSKTLTHDYTNAIEDYSHSLDLKPNATVNYMRAIAEIEMKQYANAFDDLNKSFDLKKNEPRFYYFRGSCKFHLKDLPGSIEDFDKAIELDKNYAQAYVLRGVAKIESNQKSSACEDFQMAKTLNDSSVDALIQKNCQ